MKRLFISCLFISFLFLPEYSIRTDDKALCKGMRSGTTAASSVNGSDFADLEREVINAFYKGNLYNLYESIERLLLAFPTKPESFLYYYDLVRLSDMYDYKRIERTLKSLIKAVRDCDGLDKKEIYLFTLKLELEKLLYRFNRKEAEKLSKDFFPQRRWLLIGPYNRYGLSDLNYPFMPEITTGLVGTNLKKKKVYLDSPKGMMDLEKYLYPREGVAYALATITVDKPVRIRVYSEGSYKLFINGKEVIKNIKGGLFRRYRVLRVWNTEEITIMIKAQTGEGWNFRVLLTDDDDRILNVKANPERLVFSDYEYMEELDYPFSYFLGNISKAPEDAYFRMAIYFDELESIEAVKYYRKSIALKDDPVKQYLLANCLIEHSDGDRDSALYLEGWKILDNLAERHSDLLPVQYMKFRRLIKSKSLLQAYHKGIELLSGGNKYLPLWIDFSDLLRFLGYEKEFEEKIDIIRNDFPNSIEPLQMLAQFYKKKNILKSVELYLDVLGKEYSKNSLKKLLKIYRSQGKYTDAIRLIEKYDHEDNFRKELINILIDSGNYGEAKKAVFKGLVKSDDPFYNLKLGLISYLEKQDPSMYWKRLLRISPSSYSVGDLLNYISKEKIEDPFKGYRKDEARGRIFSWLLKEHEDRSSGILYRNMIFILNEDGGSRTFCEDVIYLKDQKAIQKWGEYEVPFSGKIHPVRIRVYGSDGSFSDSYRIHKLHGNSYVTLSSLKEESIVHISYYLDNPIDEPQGSHFFTVPFTRIQNFNEELSYFSLKIIAPESIKVNFSFNRELQLTSKNVGDRVIYSASLGNLEKVHQEDFMGNFLNHLPYFAFSTMNNLNDFVMWYNGRITGSSEVDIDSIRHRFKGNSISEVVKSVYDYVTREIDLTGRVLFYPEKAMDTLFHRRGTVEDKVILARAILSELGIKSYLAFARRDDLPDPGSFVSPGNFTDILLYVPLDVKTGHWMDFSNQYYGCGIVKERLVGTNAVVLIRDEFEIKEISDNHGNSVSSTFRINLNSSGVTGFDIDIEFTGRSGGARGYFKNSIYNEDMVNYYFGNIIPSISIDDYRIVNLDERGSPFKISVKGNSFSFALMGASRIIFQPILKTSEVHRYIRYARRRFPLIIGKSIDEMDKYEYHLPPEYKSYEVDRSHDIKIKFGFVKIEIKKVKGSNILKINKRVMIEKTKIPPEEYGEFLNFCLKLKDIEHENLVIKE